MNKYICKRCGYETVYKRNLLSHLKRKKPCKAVLEQISIEELISNEVHQSAEDRPYSCQYCHNTFTCRSSKSRHEKYCCQKKKFRNKANIIEECDDKDGYYEMRDWLEDLYQNTKTRKLLILFMNNKTLFLEKVLTKKKQQKNE